MTSRRPTAAVLSATLLLLACCSPAPAGRDGNDDRAADVDGTTSRDGDDTKGGRGEGEGEDSTLDSRSVQDDHGTQDDSEDVKEQNHQDDDDDDDEDEEEGGNEFSEENDEDNDKGDDEDEEEDVGPDDGGMTSMIDKTCTADCTLPVRMSKLMSPVVLK